MLRTSLRSLWGHKRRAAITGMAVLAGVALMAGTLVLTDTVGRTFDQLFADINAGTDAYVRSADFVDADFGAGRRRIPVDVVNDVRQVPGVRAAYGGVQAYARIIGRDGEPVGNPEQGAPTFGGTWVDDPQLNPFRMAEGRAPVGDGEIVIDRGSSKTGDLSLGASTTVITQSGPVPVTIVGIATFGTADSPLGASFAMWDLESSTRLLAEPGLVDGIAVSGEPGVSEADLVARIQAVVPGDLEVITGEVLTQESQDDIGSALGFFNKFMLTFALIALFVGAFIIYNTFGIIVAQRTRETALLRAVGAGKAQVLRATVIEALLIGAIASGIGLLTGVAVAAGLKSLLGTLGFDIPATGVVVLPQSMIVSGTLGVVVTLVSAVGPARRASKILPMAAIRDVAIDESDTSRLRIVAGLLIGALGFASLGYGLFSSGGVTFVGLGAAVTFLGVAVLGPVLATPVTRFIGAPLPRLRGTVGLLARENALRHPRRTAGAAIALTIGVGLVSFVAIFATSAKASINGILDDVFQGDLIVQSDTQQYGGLDTGVAGKVAALDGVDAATGIRYSPAEQDGDLVGVFSLDPIAGPKVLDITTVTGSVADLAERNTIAVSDELATDKGLGVGDSITLKLADAGEVPMRIVATYEKNLLLQNRLVGHPTFDANVANRFDIQIYVGLDDDADSATVRAEVDRLLEPYPTAKVRDLTEFKAAQGAQLDQLLGLIYALLLLAVVIALIGITNTIALAVLERTRELGLLRAVGAARSQIRASVRWESALVALFGTAMGLVVGLVFGASLVAALRDEGIDRLAVPPGQLVAITVIAFLAGIGAGVLPARRAARLDVLAAVAEE